MNLARLRTSIRLTVVSVFILATVFTAAVAIGLQYYFSESLGRSAASDVYRASAEGIANEIGNIREINVNILDLMGRNRELAKPGNEGELLQTFHKVLRNNPLFYGIYIGRGDNSFYEVINLDASENTRDILRAVPGDRWLVTKVEDTPEGRFRSYHYLDEELALRATRTEETDYTVTERSWYASALASNSITASDPYLFAHSGEPGRTLSQRITGTEAVIGIDMTLRSMSEYLAARQVSLDSGLFIFTRDGIVIASGDQGAGQAADIPLPEISLSVEDRAYLQALGPLVVSNEMDWPPFDYSQSGTPRGYSVDVIYLIARMLDLDIHFENGHTWQELVQRFKDGKIDLLQSVVLTDKNAELGLPGRIYATLPFALVTPAGPGEILSLAQLGQRKLAIPAGWSVIPLIREAHPDLEIIEAASTLDAIAKVQRGEVDAALDNQVILEYVIAHYFLDDVRVHSGIKMGFTDVPENLHIFVHPSRERLRHLLDRAIAALGPTQKEALAEKWLDFSGGASARAAETVPSSTLVDLARDPELWGVLTETEMGGKRYYAYVNAAEQGENGHLFLGFLTPTATVMRPYLDKVRLSIQVTAGFLLLLLPLSWLFANPIVRPVKLLALQNDKVRDRKFSEVERVESHIRELDDLSESMVRMVASIRSYEAAQRELMDSFIQLIAQAIDHKSPYTGGHCERVPELALMLARAANASTDTPFAKFRLDSEEQWREYRIAAWLHDCGKITTPEHIVDKGSKLETIYNRIHEVRMRFEVLSRDAEIEYWTSLRENPEKQVQLEAELEARQRQLQDDFAFIAECNVGGEFLDETRQQRLREIAKRTWQRRFSNRLGLSPVEELRSLGEEHQLPVNEPLLADRPEHIIERTHSREYPPEYGINMEVPEHLYNQGELYNLSVSRGTLTAEDRFKINEHMISTIKMLESLPFPADLKNVPRYASTHHETMRGDGYPRKLPGESLSIPERILAVADVFEALTASDRPYKKAKPVSVAIDILHKMVEDNHIDRDCFELFLKSGVYRQYAEQFLTDEQNDEVDIGRYVA